MYMYNRNMNSYLYVHVLLLPLKIMLYIVHITVSPLVSIVMYVSIRNTLLLLLLFYYHVSFLETHSKCVYWLINASLIVGKGLIIYMYMYMYITPHNGDNNYRLKENLIIATE